MLNEFASYDHAYSYDNVYGHAVELLRRNLATTENSNSRQIHLDLGCGYGRIAEQIASQFGLHYVGVDANGDGLASLAERGFETHPLTFGDYQSTFDALKKICAGRKIASVTMLDVLEHLPNGDDVLQAIRELIAEQRSLLVTSVPNVAHRDIGFRLAFGRWDYTEQGLLDHTHTRLFTAGFFKYILNYNGLHPIDTNNVEASHSDQYFPDTHSALAKGSLLHNFLDGLRRRSDPSATVNQFVFACTAGPRIGAHPYTDRSSGNRPFLSIVMRTQGKRIHCMAEVFTALAAQTERDFEVIVVGHKLSDKAQILVERAIEDNPTWLRNKTRLIRVNEGNRTRPLNVGFEAAQGRYMSIMDDDDLPFAHWVETFKSLAESHDGKLLRAVCVKQDVKIVQVLKRTAIRAEASPEKYPSDFDLFRHLNINETPNVCVAFPRGAFHDLGMKFDESLTTTEDWDYMMRVIFVVGIATLPEITSVYHWWLDGHQSSRTDHSNDEWRSNHEAIWAKFDRMPLLLPENSARKLRQLLEHSPPAEMGQGTNAPLSPGVLMLIELLESTSWKVTSPLRLFGRLRGRRATSIHGALSMSDEQARVAANAIQSSRSWRAAAPLRALRTRLKR